MKAGNPRNTRRQAPLLWQAHRHVSRVTNHRILRHSFRIFRSPEIFGKFCTILRRIKLGHFFMNVTRRRNYIIAARIKAGALQELKELGICMGCADPSCLKPRQSIKKRGITEGQGACNLQNWVVSNFGFCALTKAMDTKGRATTKIAIKKAKAKLLILVRAATEGHRILLTMRGQPVAETQPFSSTKSSKEKLATPNEITKRAASKGSVGPSAAQSADFLYSNKGMPQ
jgi:prevent-host-death family protein